MTKFDKHDGLRLGVQYFDSSLRASQVLRFSRRILEAVEHRLGRVGSVRLKTPFFLMLTFDGKNVQKV